MVRIERTNRWSAPTLGQKCHLFLVGWLVVWLLLLVVVVVMVVVVFENPWVLCSTQRNIYEQ